MSRELTELIFDLLLKHSAGLTDTEVADALVTKIDGEGHARPRRIRSALQQTVKDGSIERDENGRHHYRPGGAQVEMNT
jgi:hypothetical protein